MILVLDYGSQTTQLIARRVREAKVFSQILPYSAKISRSQYPELKGVILSGGPASVYEKGGYPLNADLLKLGVPILGICYGAQLLSEAFGGKVEAAKQREFGRAKLNLSNRGKLFDEVANENLLVWMSHGDKIVKLSEDFEILATSDHSPFAAFGSKFQPLYGLQFHPEVHHTKCGAQLISNFVHKICGCDGRWTAETFIESAIAKIRSEVGRGKVVCAVSGGVDSTVMAALLTRAVGEQCTAIFVDNGLLRKNEAVEVRKFLEDELKLNLKFKDASSQFLSALKGVEDPEVKRKIIGKTFIDVFDSVAAELGGAEFLAQGTLYPDLIESTSFVGPSATIKSHHNVGGLPHNIKFKLIEPLRELFKDEVREVGKILGITPALLARHPFPGPGLAVRIIGALDQEKLRLSREADAIFIEELKKSGQYDKVWQAFVVLTPIKTVGVMGDARTYEYVAALRAVQATDGMTADWAPLPHDLLAHVSNRITNEVRGINRVVYDISSKPPSTIEWE